jgi:hypothetical protein
MPANSNITAYFKCIVQALAGVILAVLGFVVVGLFGDFFKANPVVWHVAVSENLGIDLFGAVLPIAFGLACAAMVVGFLSLSKS